MSSSTTIRETAAADMAALTTLYEQAFPDEDLVPLVRDLLQIPSEILSLVSLGGTAITGHVVFTKCAIGSGGKNGALLGPLAVMPARQRRGVGRALIRRGIEQLAGEGVETILVLGNPAYYGRFGFLPQSCIAPPYPLPTAWLDAWQSLQIGEAKARPAGELNLPAPWMKPAYWSS